MDTPRIPLLRLPLRVQKLVLGNMNEVYQLAISLLSIKTQKLIKSLKIYSVLPRIVIVDCIRIGFIFYSGHFVLEFYDSKNLQNQLFIRYREGDNVKRVVWIFKKELTVKDWLDHFMDVLNIQNIKELLFRDIGHFRFLSESLKDIAGYCETLTIDDRCSDEDTLKIAGILLGEKTLQLDRLSIKRQKVLLGNHRNVKFMDFQLNDLLACNALKIQATSRIPDKHLNRFLKLWIHGANPRLQKLVLEWPHSFTRNYVQRDPNVILNGIQTVPVFSEHKAKLPRHPHSRRSMVQTEVDLMKKDGTWATLVVTNIFPFCADVMFIVWD